jgi:hypothetical protein
MSHFPLLIDFSDTVREVNEFVETTKLASIECLHRWEHHCVWQLNDRALRRPSKRSKKVRERDATFTIRLISRNDLLSAQRPSGKRTSTTMKPNPGREGSSSEDHGRTLDYRPKLVNHVQKTDTTPSRYSLNSPRPRDSLPDLTAARYWGRRDTLLPLSDVTGTRRVKPSQNTAELQLACGEPCRKHRGLTRQPGCNSNADGPRWNRIYTVPLFPDLVLPMQRSV